MQQTSGVTRKLALAFHVLSVLLFLASLTQVAYVARTHNGESDMYGIFALLLGFIGSKAWYANPLLALAYVALFKWSGYLSALLAIAGFGLTLTFLSPGQVVPVGSMGMYPYEARLGFYLWVSSIVFACASGLVAGRALQTNTRPRSDA